MTEGGAVGAGGATGVEPKVNLTLDSSDGRIPGSGSSLKGFGKVVRAVSGVGRPVIGAARGTATLGPSVAASILICFGDMLFEKAERLHHHDK